jgi:hypothetical protein
VDVDEVAGAVALVAADPFPVGPVEVGELVEPAAHQHRMHRRSLDPEAIGDLYRAKTMLQPQPHDLAHHARLGAVGLSVRRRAPVQHPGRTLVPVPHCPLRRGLPRHVVPLGHTRRWPALVDDQTREPKPGTRSQSINGMGSVSREDLLGEAVP